MNVRIKEIEAEIKFVGQKLQNVQTEKVFCTG